MLNIPKPASVISLATNSILVSVETHVCTFTKQDRQTTQEVATDKKASNNAVRVSQNLFAGNTKLKEILNYVQTVQNWVKSKTYPWAAGADLLPAIRIPEFMHEYQTIHHPEFYRRVDSFFGPNNDNYNDLIGTMAMTMGDLFNRNNYPPAAVARAKFSINLYTSEVPQGDFRVSISADAAEDMRKHTLREVEKHIELVSRAQADKFADLMQSLSHCLTTETVQDANGNVKIKRNKLYDSTIEKALSLCDELKEFNPTSDTVLDDARCALEKTLRGVAPELLRDSDSVRSRVKDEVDSILKLFGGV